MKMIEWDGGQAGSAALDCGDNDADSGKDRGGTGRLQEMRDSVEQQETVEQQDNLGQQNKAGQQESVGQQDTVEHRGHDEQPAEVRAPSAAPVLRLMVNGEWVPLKVVSVSYTWLCQ